MQLRTVRSAYSPWQGKELHIVPQNLVELWVAATRPFGENGLGMDAIQAATETPSTQRGKPWCGSTWCWEDLRTTQGSSPRCRFMESRTF